MTAEASDAEHRSGSAPIGKRNNRIVALRIENWPDARFWETF